MENFYYKSPIGVLKISCENNCLVSLKLVQKVCKSDVETSFSSNIKTQLEEYFSGKRQNFDIKINPSGTDFQKQVWNQLLKIPYGKTKSYSEIAEEIGNGNAQRAVGSACNKNPVIIIVPCHRVISKNGDIGGFAYGTGVKNILLNIESGYAI